MDGVGPGGGAAFAWTSQPARGSHMCLVVVLEASLPMKPVQKKTRVTQSKLVIFIQFNKLTLGVPGNDWLGPGMPVTSGIRGGCAAPAPPT